jgi:acyl-CoA thioester hydrolase
MIVNGQFRVLYGDTDAMGQAYYGNYLKWFEVGRAEWFRCCGMTYRELELQGIYLPVVEAHCQYLQPAFYDDLLGILTRFHFPGPARLRFDYEIRRQGELLATGYTVHVCVNRDRRVLKPPDRLKRLLEPCAETIRGADDPGQEQTEVS